MYKIIYSHEGVVVSDHNIPKWATQVTNLIRKNKRPKTFKIGSYLMITTLINTLLKKNINCDRIVFKFDTDSYIDPITRTLNPPPPRDIQILLQNQNEFIR